MPGSITLTVGLSGALQKYSYRNQELLGLVTVVLFICTVTNKRIFFYMLFELGFLDGRDVANLNWSFMGGFRVHALELFLYVIPIPPKSRTSGHHHVCLRRWRIECQTDGRGAGQRGR